MTNRNISDPRALLQGIGFKSEKEVLRDIVKSLADVHTLNAPYHSQQSGNYTTLARSGQAYPTHETVETTGTSTQTITLSQDHVDTDRVTVTRNGSGNVSIATEGSEKVVNEDTFSPFARYSSVTLYKQTNWFIERAYEEHHGALIDEFGIAITDENGEVISAF